MIGVQTIHMQLPVYLPRIQGDSPLPPKNNNNNITAYFQQYVDAIIGISIWGETQHFPCSA